MESGICVTRRPADKRPIDDHPSWNRLRPLIERAGSDLLLPAMLLLAMGIPPVPAWSQSVTALKLVSPAKPVPDAPPPVATATPTTTVQAIPLAQVADQAEELDQKLEEISRHLTVKPAGIAPEEVVGTQAAEIGDRALHVDRFLQQTPDILQLRDELVYWRGLSYRSGEQRKLLTARAAELQSQIVLLDEEQARWQATRDQIRDTEGIEVVAARVQHELDAIRGIRAQAQEQLNQVLTLQNQTSQTARQISESLTKLSEAEEKFRGRLLDRDGVALWAPSAFREASLPVGRMLNRAADQNFTTADEFVRAQGATLLLMPVLFGLALLAAFRLRTYVGTEEKPGVPPDAIAVFCRPYSIALLVTLIASIPQTDSAPVSISLVLYLLWLGLVFRLTPLLVAVELRPLLYLLLVLNLLEVVRVGLPLPSGLSRLLLTSILLAALILFAWMSRPSRIRRMGLAGWPLRLLEWGTRFGLFLLGAAVLANLFGFVSLSHVLGVGTVLSAFFAAALYLVVRIAFLLLVILVGSKWANSFPDDVRANIELWGLRILVILAVTLWAMRSELYVFLFQDTLTTLVAGVLGFSVGLGKVHITVGNVLGVVLILALGYGLAKGVSSLLRSVLLAKFPLRRGLPYAVSKVAYYCLMLLVFTTAITSAGVELNRFTVITGALGVGVGFGLQNIVSNFASGLILLFERPIRVEDVIEVSGLIGTVRRIGARSSTITTAQGAEVIVPNSNLLSNNVVNWTLSSPWRRVEIPVGVEYGCDPEAVLQLLVSVAASHSDVMSDPAPAAYFLGFGDSALNFELRFWSAKQDTWFQLKSDVTLRVARALREADIEIPFPQRDLHLRSIDPSVQGSLAARLPAVAPPEATPAGPPHNEQIGE